MAGIIRSVTKGQELAKKRTKKKKAKKKVVKKKAIKKIKP